MRSGPEGSLAFPRGLKPGGIPAGPLLFPAGFSRPRFPNTVALCPRLA